ncbi:MAG: hypothetical protein HKN73_20830 [Gemmatimonadetes bacterium]|nr:hypothetical protein [Gemmatimonadota bacterium]
MSSAVAGPVADGAAEEARPSPGGEPVTGVTLPQLGQETIRPLSVDPRHTGS